MSDVCATFSVPLFSCGATPAQIVLVFYYMIYWDPPLMNIYDEVTALQQSCITLCGIFLKLILCLPISNFYDEIVFSLLRSDFTE